MSNIPSEVRAVAEMSEEDWKASLKSPNDYRTFDKMATGMTRYHDHFARDFKQIYALAGGDFQKMGMDLEDFLDYASSLSQYLHTHHGIEESYIFPDLASRMPEFQGHLPDQHKGIHAGLDLYDADIAAFRKDRTSYKPEKLRATMDSFREVLFTHLDEEVQALRANNMRKYWTLQEIRNMPL